MCALSGQKYSQYILIYTDKNGTAKKNIFILNLKFRINIWTKYKNIIFNTEHNTLCDFIWKCLNQVGKHKFWYNIIF